MTEVAQENVQQEAKSKRRVVSYVELLNVARTAASIDEVQSATGLSNERIRTRLNELFQTYVVEPGLNVVSDVTTNGVREVTFETGNEDEVRVFRMFPGQQGGKKTTAEDILSLLPSANE